MPKMVLKFPVVFPGRQVEKRMFPYRKPTAYITLPCATALACDDRRMPVDRMVEWCNANRMPVKSSNGGMAVECLSPPWSQ